MILNWFATLARDGRRARSTGSSRGTSAIVLHVYAFGSLAANPFPGFTGAAGRYPLDLVLSEEPQRQNRWKTLFRLFLAVPAWIVSIALGYALFVAPSSRGSSRSSPGPRRGVCATSRPTRCATSRRSTRTSISSLIGIRTQARSRARTPGRRRWLPARCRPSDAQPVVAPLLSAPSGLSPPGCSGARQSRRSICRTSTSMRSSRRRSLRRAQHYSAVERLFWLGQTITQLVVLGFFARYGRALDTRVRRRADRHRDAARDDRLRARLGGRAAVRGARRLVEPPATASLAATCRRRSATGSRWAAVRPALRGARDRDGLRSSPPDRRPLVAARRTGVRRAADPARVRRPVVARRQRVSRLVCPELERIEHVHVPYAC